MKHTESKIKHLLKQIQQNYSTFGVVDETSYYDTGNPISMALKNKPLMFALGIDVESVIHLILQESGFDELLKALEKYGEHLGTCYKNLKMGECNCGLEQAIANAEEK